MQVRIKGYTFQLTEPFTEGQVITKGEAQALNGLRAENIQNNLRKLVAEATAALAPGELLTLAQIDQIQEKITRYDREYQFLEKHIPRPRIGDIEIEARTIAESRVPEDLPDAEREALVSEMAALPAVMEEAREIVAAKRRALSGGLESL